MAQLRTDGEKVDSGRIAHGWDHAASSGGGVKRIGEPSARQFGDYTVVDRTQATAE